MIQIPSAPEKPPLRAPSMNRPLSVTKLEGGVLMTMPGPPFDARMATCPTLSQTIAIDLVIVNWPKPAESRQLISPPAAVLGSAPAKVLHGAVRLHGAVSSPMPDTQVRKACAEAETWPNIPAANNAATINAKRLIDTITDPPF